MALDMILDKNKIISDYSFFSLLRYKYNTHLVGVRESLWEQYSLPIEQIKFIEKIREIEKFYDLRLEYWVGRNGWVDAFKSFSSDEKNVINHFFCRQNNLVDSIRYDGYEFLREYFKKYRIYQDGNFSLEHLPDFLQSSFSMEMNNSFNHAGKTRENIVILNIEKAYLEMEKLFHRYALLEVLNIEIHFPNDHRGEEGYDRFINNIKPILERVQLSLHDDQRLVKGFFKLEDDGRYGLNYSCILVYPKEAGITKQVIENQLKPVIANTLAEMHDRSIPIDSVAGMKTSGTIDTLEKLQAFCHWHVGYYYLYDFYIGLNPIVQDQYALKINHIHSHEWNIDLQFIGSNIDQEQLIQYHALQNYSSDSKAVWKVEHLPETLIQKHQYLNVFVNEINIPNFDLDAKRVLQYLEIFIDSLKHSNEPFFRFDVAATTKKKNQIRVTRLGNQLLFLYKYFKQKTVSIGSIDFYNNMRGGVLNQLFYSDLWNTILITKNIVGQDEAHSILLNLKKLAFFNDILKKSVFRDEKGVFSVRTIAYGPSDQILKNTSPTVDKNISYFINQTLNTQKYVKNLFKEDSFITRAQFYCTTITNLDFFSKNLTDFLRIYRSKAILKGLKGYFLVWLLDSDGLPVVDVIFILQYHKSYGGKDFIFQLDNQWKEFIENKLQKLQWHIQDANPCVKQDAVLSLATSSLTQYFVAVEASDHRLKQDIYHNIVPYFTFRHYFLASNIQKKKLFSKGSVIKSK
ncbi:hypothetical protein F934_00811 [Acinetobacter beijerinckii ANC 3835]|uniref:Uncharacterized protein n=2 Tax=Acinetobacter beijerinckii TaxID=262668 RepID=N9FF83_9GAMM|nr:hypothetical protein F934_00811 [Acinetobacter beijerinckii ANC 3835]